MDWKVFSATFGLVFLAEMGDKTQLAALCMAAQTRSFAPVLIGACAALCLATLLGVAFGSLLAAWLPATAIKRGAGALFILIGAIMLLGKW